MDYKVGDNVKITARLHGHMFDIGEVVTITSVSNIDYRANNKWWIQSDEFELTCENPDSSKGIAKPLVMRGCDLKGRGAGLTLGLIFAKAGGKGEFVMDGEFVQALLNEMVQLN